VTLQKKAFLFLPLFQTIRKHRIKYAYIQEFLAIQNSIEYDPCPTWIVISVIYLQSATIKSRSSHKVFNARSFFKSSPYVCKKLAQTIRIAGFESSEFKSTNNKLPSQNIVPRRANGLCYQKAVEAGVYAIRPLFSERCRLKLQNTASLRKRYSIGTSSISATNNVSTVCPMSVRHLRIERLDREL